MHAPNSFFQRRAQTYIDNICELVWTETLSIMRLMDIAQFVVDHVDMLLARFL